MKKMKKMKEFKHTIYYNSSFKVLRQEKNFVQGLHKGIQQYF